VADVWVFCDWSLASYFVFINNSALHCIAKARSWGVVEAVEKDFTRIYFLI
jgi:hypothetical protein